MNQRSDNQINVLKRIIRVAELQSLVACFSPVMTLMQLPDGPEHAEQNGDFKV